jgi:hypothetical protein
MKGEQARPFLESATFFDESLTDTYATKLRIYLAINLSAVVGFVLFNVTIDLPVQLGLELFNVFLVIVFITTLWRVRAYVARLAGSLGVDPNAYYFSTMGSYLGMVLVYFHSAILLKEYSGKNKSS